MRPYHLPLLLCAACTPAMRAPATPAPADTGRIAVDGGTLYYESQGSGPAVVLLHGGRMDLRSWDAQAGALAPGFRVIRYDAGGHGRSTAPLDPPSQTEHVTRVLDHLGVQRAHVVGLSMGGGAALDFAFRHPERVESLVLVSTSGPPPGIPVDSNAVLTHPAGRRRLGALPMPRLLVVGERDSPGVLAAAQAVRNEAPGVEVASIPGAHLPNQDAPEAFNQLLLRFLRR
ncbi:MAG TPA: alpha/beta fold hydrolase [Longimicrobium sp.]